MVLKNKNKDRLVERIRGYSLSRTFVSWHPHCPITESRTGRRKFPSPDGAEEGGSAIFEDKEPSRPDNTDKHSKSMIKIKTRRIEPCQPELWIFLSGESKNIKPSFSDALEVGAPKKKKKLTITPSSDHTAVLQAPFNAAFSGLH